MTKTMIKLPAMLVEEANKILEIAREVSAEDSNCDVVEKVAERLGITTKQVRAIVREIVSNAEEVEVDEEE